MTQHNRVKAFMNYQSKFQNPTFSLVRNSKLDRFLLTVKMRKAHFKDDEFEKSNKGFSPIVINRNVHLLSRPDGLRSLYFGCEIFITSKIEPGSIYPLL